MKILKDTPIDSNAAALLDRNKCFAIVAAAVKNAASDSVVDLKSPEVKQLLSFLTCSQTFYFILRYLGLFHLYDQIYSFLFLLSCYHFLEYPMDR